MNDFEPSLAPDQERLISTRKLAEILEVHPNTITRSWVPDGCPVELRLPRGYRFLMSRVRAWLAERHGGAMASNETAKEIADKVKVAFAKLEDRRRKGRAS